ncbi:hypothetical protein GP486_006950 [Trichoglossum hirsutum]|uniref:Lytic polysaccharide monooxygenase n=1 Tax=Trichoglossum hirsutum TaxID=265104 RepID=A0A9P8L573_9PEZI|nr:hypothetical protein GP486_006950 [Trichoglossum hirsutum]
MAINGTRFPDARNGSSTLPGDLVLDGLALHNARVTFNFPLAQNGTDYPCKFQNGVSPIFGTDSGGVVEWAAGQTAFFNFERAALTANSFTESDNIAAHGGGSCQVSLSFDGGNNFQVIQSWVGGCPANATWNSNDLPPRDISPQIFNFKVPNETPNGHAIFAWTWFPISGQISMHMNCAWINISNSSNPNGHGLDSTDYPPLFVANVDKVNSCKGKDGFDVVFPNPGKQATTATGTQTASKYAATTVSGNCTGIAQVTSTAASSTTKATASSAKPTTTKSEGASPTFAGVQSGWRRVSDSGSTFRLDRSS